MKRLGQLPFTPFLAAAYPILALFAHNIEFIEGIALLRPLSISLLATAGLFFLSWLWKKETNTAALLTTLGVMLFFSYGHSYSLLKEVILYPLVRHRVLVPIWVAIFIAGVWWARRGIPSARKITETLNLISFVLVALPSAQILLYNYEAISNRLQARAASELSTTNGGAGPDIYYIVLDAYGRADVLEEVYGFDNEVFLKRLQELGFYVADCSLSNYPRTNQALTSALYMEYVHELFDDPNSLPAWQHSSVRQILERLNYNVVTIENGYSRTAGLNPDIYIQQDESSYEGLRFLGALSEFEAELIDTTMGLLLTDSATFFPGAFQVDPQLRLNLDHYERTLFLFEQLEKITAYESPKFVMTHLLVPHEPYIFSPEGHLLEEQSDPIQGYVDQVEFVNRRLLPVIEKILEESSTAPILIIQGDHGPPILREISTPEQRMKILNAYFLPGDAASQLWPGITPVNSFRLIFNSYLGGNFQMLEDKGYYSPTSRLEEISIVTDDACGGN